MSIDLTANCVAHYKMNDNAASAVVIDSQGFSNGTAQQNTNLLDTVGKVGGALTFNGASDYVETTLLATNFQDSFSINLWCKPNDGQPVISNPLFGMGNTPQAHSCYIGLTTEGRVYFSLDDATMQSLVLTSGILFSNGTQAWNMLTFVVEETTGSTATVYLYLNGTFIANVINDNVMDSFLGLNPRIGRGRIGGVYNYFAGSIDNVMIFNKALSAEEITYLYNFGLGTEALAESYDDIIDEAIFDTVNGISFTEGTSVEGVFFL